MASGTLLNQRLALAPGGSGDAMPCPYCGEAGAEFRGSREAEQDHFLRRILWDAHRLRIALEDDITGPGMARMASQIIRDIESLATLIHRLRVH
jgi:hypothetical protein